MPSAFFRLSGTVETGRRYENGRTAGASPRPTRTDRRGHRPLREWWERVVEDVDPYENGGTGRRGLDDVFN